jgi:subtilase family serine protease
MRARISRTSVVSFATLALLSLLPACSGGGGSIPSTDQSATKSASTSTASATRFLPSATSGTPDASNIVYNVNPPYKLAYAAGTKPAAFPPPSACVAHFGLACYTPALIKTGYNIPSTLTGAGQTIVIVDAYGSPTIAQDLKTFDAAMGLPDPTLNIYYPTGTPPALNPSHQGAAASWAAETSLDVEWSHAIAPGATIDLVIASSNYGNVLNVAQRFVVENHLGNVMSLSFGSPEAAIQGAGNNIQLQQADAIYQAAQNAGITVFVSSGDSGASNGYSVANANFPASDPLVTSVGGTNLFLADSGAYQSEDVWNDANACPFGCKDGIFGATGGAPSKIFAAPAYQRALSGMAARTTSDVGYNASVYTAVLVYLGWANPAGFYFFGGTSEGAPQWAGIAALADQAGGHSIGFINPKLYAIGANAGKYAADFHDITSGNNDFFGPGFPAKTGYDLPTGLGTPNGAHLIPDLITP